MTSAKENLIKNWASFLGGFLTLSLGILVLITWYLDTTTKTSLPFHFVTVQFSTAASLIISGISIMFLDVHYRKWALGFSFIALIITLSASLYYLFNVDFGLELLMPHYRASTPIEHLGRMALNTSISLAVANLAIIFLSSKKHEVYTGIAIILSAAASTLSLISLIGHISNVELSFTLLNFSRVSILSGLMSFIFSISVFLYAVKYFAGSKLKNLSLPIAMFIVILSVTVTMWQTFRAQTHFSLQRYSVEKLEHLQYTFDESIQKEFEIFERMANRWEALQEFPSKVWYIDAEDHINKTAGINEIALYNKDLEREKVALRHPDSTFDFAKALTPSDINRLKNEETVGKPLENKKYLSLYFPLVVNREFLGFIAAEIDLVALLKYEIKFLRLSKYKVALYFEDEDLFNEGQDYVGVTKPIYADVASKYGPWRIKLTLTGDVNLSGFGFSSIHNLVLITGIFISILTGTLVFFGQSLTKQKEYLEDSNLQLEEASKRAVAANAAKGTFLATMSHEIRTPLNAVIATAELLQESDPTETQKKYLNRVISSSTLLLELISNILDFSKIEAGDLVLQKEPIDVLAIIKNVATDLTLKNKNKEVDIFVECPSESLPNLILDPVRLQQVISNLANNALKFTEKGHIILRLLIKSQSKDSVLIRFEVEDTGIGISTTNKEKIFTKFTQVEDTLTRKYGGVGLGLSICKKLVGIMEGEIGESGEESKGAIFWVELSFKTEEDEEALIPYSLEGKSILLIDEREIEAQILKRYLSDWGAKVFDSKDSKECDITLSSAINETYENKTVLIYDLGINPDMRRKAGVIFRPILPNELYKSLIG
jgi:signal transduction histidine kinase